MASDYSELYLGDELTKLRDGLEVIERVVDGADIVSLNIWLYGIVTDSFILDIAKEAIIADAEEFMDDNGDTDLTESDVELTEIAVAVPISSPDVIDILHGRGYPCRELDFAYQAGAVEGVRTKGFLSAHTSSARITADNLKDQVIANGEDYLDSYLKEKGNKSVMTIRKTVNRDQEATEHPHPEGTEPEVPAAAPEPTAPPATPTPPATPSAMPKQTSLKLSSIVEDFLGG